MKAGSYVLFWIVFLNKSWRGILSILLKVQIGTRRYCYPLSSCRARVPMPLLKAGRTRTGNWRRHDRQGRIGRDKTQRKRNAAHCDRSKLFSRLARGVTHAPYFDQAARSVACIAELLYRANRRPDQFSSLGFYIIAPQSQIEAHKFSREISKDSVKSKVSIQSDIPPNMRPVSKRHAADVELSGTVLRMAQ